VPALSIFSGGQTGVDRAALDAALAAGAPCGGWCPAGRLAEDGAVPERYPLRELAEGGYRERTRANVRDSGGTLVIHAGELEGGTAQTVNFCRAHGKPCLLIDSNAVTPAAAAATVRRFVADHRIAILNVAGPRASKHPGIYDYAFALVTSVLKDAPADA
jgi:hypothetical protein